MNSRGVPAPVSNRISNPRLYPATWIQIALLHVVSAAQPDPTHAAAIEDQGEAAFHQFGTKLECLPSHPGE